MEREARRKRPGSGGGDGGQRRARPRWLYEQDDGGGGDVSVVDRTATEDEVEEFFAIIRRMHAAAVCFSGGADKAKARSAGRGEEKSLFRWKPAFLWEDFENERGYNDTAKGGVGDRIGKASTSGPAAADGEKRTGLAAAAENGFAGSLDLNAEPVPEKVPDQ